MPGGSGYSDFPSPNNPWSIPTFLSEEDPEDIYRTQWSPPALQPRFLESILNPVDSEPPPSNQSARPPRNPRPFSPLSPHFTHSSAPSMPPSRSARLPSGYVDLTNDSNISPEPTPPKRRRSPSPGSSKRLKRNVGTEAKKEGGSSGADIQEIDLSDDKADIRGVLEKQRVETIKAEANPEEKAITFNTFTCVICMDAPKDLTATSCGQCSARWSSIGHHTLQY